MPSIQIRVRLGKSSKSFTGNKRLIKIGRAGNSDLTLPFPFLRDEHLLIESTPWITRVRAASADAPATVEGKPLGTSWVNIPSPGHIEIPTNDGKRLCLDLMSTEPRLNAGIMRDPDAAAAGMDHDHSSVQILSHSRFHSATDAGVEAGGAIDGEITEQVDWRETLPWWASKTVVLSSLGTLYCMLIIGALLFNRYRIANERQQIADDTQLVSSKIDAANGMIRSGQYAEAKAALDVAEPIAQRIPQLSEKLAEITRIRKSKEIELGANGYVKVGEQWYPEDQARQIKSAREIDDPKIAGLERQAAEAVAAGRYDDAKSACQQALAIMKAEPLQPHPRAAVVTAMLQTITNQSITADMAAKGYVLYQGKWVKAEDKFRQEQEAKGLVLHDGQWMTREQANEAQTKAAQGLVLYQGKWVTPDQKMEAQGLVKFEDRWITPKERDDLIAKRKADEVAAKAEQAKSAEIKKVAYAHSQDFLRRTAALPKAAQFPEFDSDKVTVVQDQGWFIVQAVVTYIPASATASVTKTYYCKLRPRPSSTTEWEADTTSFAE